MKSATLIRNAQINGDDTIRHADILIVGEKIARIEANIQILEEYDVVNALGQPVLPGLIDDQVHFRESGNAHMGDMTSESQAALLGGITSVLDMPSTAPATTSRRALEEKYHLAETNMATNYGFYLGATPDNLEEIRYATASGACGITVSMGASMDSPLIEQPEALAAIFKSSPLLIATQCEDGPIIQKNLGFFREKYGAHIPISAHPLIRSAEACYRSSSVAVGLAKKYGSRLHVLHLSTEKELELFEAGPRHQKRITAEACVHHLFFEESDYARLGTRIKLNPAIKKKSDREALRRAVLEDRIDVIATNHATHRWEEKQKPYAECPAGAPIVQHALPALLELSAQGGFSLQAIVDKFCHAPADLFGIQNRGYLKEGAYADIVLVKLNQPFEVTKESLHYRCVWSPFYGHTFPSRVHSVWRNGKQVVKNGTLEDVTSGKRLLFSGS